MNKTTSLYLDTVRFLAAFVVFVAHATSDKFTGGLPLLWRFFWFANDAVMVFFVLSGFVIAFVANGKEDSLDKYFISRFARLYSVVLPALLLTVVLDLIGSQFSYDQLYTGWGYDASNPIVRFLTNLFFVNQLWFLDIRPFSNIPFWSISYEFCYYVIFAVWFYVKTPRKYPLLLLVSLLIGPKVLILLPIWFMGVWVYRITCSTEIPEEIGWVLFLSSIVLYVLYRKYGGTDYLFEQTKLVLGADQFSRLGWSREFVSGYVVGPLIAANFIGASVVSHRFSLVLEFFEKPIRYLASYTFALYLLHYPLLQFFSAITYDPGTARTEPVIVVVGTLISVWILGSITEKQKGKYKILFEKMWRLTKRG